MNPQVHLKSNELWNGSQLTAGLYSSCTVHRLLLFHSKCSEVSHYLIKLLRAEITDKPHKIFRESVLKRNRNANHYVSQLLITSPVTLRGFFPFMYETIAEKISVELCILFSIRISQSQLWNQWFQLYMLKLENFRVNQTNSLNPSIAESGNLEEYFELSHLFLQIWQIERKKINIWSIQTYTFYIFHVISK